MGANQSHRQISGKSNYEHHRQFPNDEIADDFYFLRHYYQRTVFISLTNNKVQILEIRNNHQWIYLILSNDDTIKILKDLLSKKMEIEVKIFHEGLVLSDDAQIPKIGRLYYKHILSI